jgi:hypothetical protein
MSAPVTRIRKQAKKLAIRIKKLKRRLGADKKRKNGK